MPRIVRIEEVKDSQVWTINENTIIFEQPFENTDYKFFASAPNATVVVTGTVVNGKKTRASITIDVSNNTSDGYYQATGEEASTTFFIPSDVLGSGFQQSSGIVSLIDNSNKLAVGVSNSDVVGYKNVFANNIVTVNSPLNSPSIAIKTLTTYVAIDSSHSGSSSTLPIVFSIDGTEVARISITGMLGIGKSNPSVPVDIQRSTDGWVFYAQRSGGVKFGIYCDATSTSFGTSNTGTVLKMIVGSNSILQADEYGSLGINTPPSSGYTLNINHQNFGTWYYQKVHSVEYNTNAYYGLEGVHRMIAPGYIFYTGTLATAIIGLVINDVQQVGVGKLPAHALDVAGVIRNTLGAKLCTTGGYCQIGPEVPDQGYKLYVNGNFKAQSIYGDSLGGIWNDGVSFLSTAFIGAGISAPTQNSSAVLQVYSTSKGFLPPQMTTAQRTAINSPADGLIVHDITLHKLFVSENSTWKQITTT